MTDHPKNPTTDQRRGTQRIALMLLAIAAVGLLAGAARPWTTGGSTGTEVAGLMTSLPLVAAAGIAGVLAARSRQRVMVGIILIAAPAFGLLDWFVGAGNDGRDDAVGMLVWWPWPIVTLLAAAAMAAGGLLAAIHGPDWPEMGSRYSRGGEGPADRRRSSAWDDLDEGRDPTA